MLSIAVLVLIGYTKSPGNSRLQIIAGMHYPKNKNAIIPVSTSKHKLVSRIHGMVGMLRQLKVSVRSGCILPHKNTVGYRDFPHIALLDLLTL